MHAVLNLDVKAFKLKVKVSSAQSQTVQNVSGSVYLQTAVYVHRAVEQIIRSSRIYGLPERIFPQDWFNSFRQPRFQKSWTMHKT